MVVVVVCFEGCTLWDSEVRSAMKKIEDQKVQVVYATDKEREMLA